MKEVSEIKKRVGEKREDIIQFLRDIVAIPSMDGQLKDVGDRIQAEMRKLGFDEVRFDKMGNTIGRIGNGPKVIVFDSHIDKPSASQMGRNAGRQRSIWAQMYRRRCKSIKRDHTLGRKTAAQKLYDRSAGRRCARWCHLL